MSADFIKERKKQKYLIVISGLVVLAAVFVLWFGYFREPEVSFEIVPIVTVKEITVDFSIFEHPFLQEFSLFEDVPPFQEERGRENPFLPY